MEIVTHLAVLFTSLFLLHSTDANNILLVPAQQVSHVLELSHIGGALVSAGHSVYIVLGSTFPHIHTVQSHGLLVLTYRVHPEHRAMFYSSTYGEEYAREFTKENMDYIYSMLWSETAMEDCKNMMSDKALLVEIQSISFHFAVVDGILIAPCGFILPHHLGIPYAYSFPGASVGWLRRETHLPSFVPVAIPPYTDRMNFMERLSTFFTYFILCLPLFPALRDHTLLTEYAPEVHSWNDLVLRSKLFIVTNDHHLDYPVSSMPNFVRVPGITWAPAEPLPMHLQTVLQSPQQGLILISSGTIAGQTPPEIIDNFLTAINQLPEYAFLWKVGIDHIDQASLPANLHTVDWLPQNDMLGQNSTLLFITHCGNAGQYEAVYHGVPMLGLPVGADQHYNALRMTHKGYGLTMDVYSLSAQELINNIRELIHNPKYSEAVKKASARMRSLPLSPRDTIVHWIEHVMTFGGDHLRSTAFDMPLYQFLMLDIMAILTVILLLLVLTCISLCWCIRNKLFLNRTKVKVQ